MMMMMMMISFIYSSLNFSINLILLDIIFPKYLNSKPLSVDLFYNMNTIGLL